MWTLERRWKCWRKYVEVYPDVDSDSNGCADRFPSSYARICWWSVAAVRVRCLWRSARLVAWGYHCTRRRSVPQSRPSYPGSHASHVGRPVQLQVTRPREPSEESSFLGFVFILERNWHSFKMGLKRNPISLYSPWFPDFSSLVKIPWLFPDWKMPSHFSSPSRNPVHVRFRSVWNESFRFQAKKRTR